MEIKNVRSKSLIASAILICAGLILCLTSLIMTNFNFHAIASQGSHPWYQTVNYTPEHGYYFGVIINH